MRSRYPSELARPLQGYAPPSGPDFDPDPLLIVADLHDGPQAVVLFVVARPQSKSRMPPGWRRTRIIDETDAHS